MSICRTTSWGQQWHCARIRWSWLVRRKVAPKDAACSWALGADDFGLFGLFAWSCSVASAGGFSFCFLSNSRIRVTWDKSPDAEIAQVGPDQRILDGRHVYKFIVIEQPPIGGPIDSALFSEVHGLDQNQKTATHSAFFLQYHIIRKIPWGQQLNRTP